jgi:hypothetical protein
LKIKNSPVKRKENGYFVKFKDFELAELAFGERKLKIYKKAQFA